MLTAHQDTIVVWMKNEEPILRSLQLVRQNKKNIIVNMAGGWCQKEIMMLIHKLLAPKLRVSGVLGVSKWSPLRTPQL